MTGDEAASLADVLEELQNIRVEIAALSAQVPTHTDIVVVWGILFVVIGVVIGVGAALAFREWFK